MDTPTTVAPEVTTVAPETTAPTTVAPTNPAGTVAPSNDGTTSPPPPAVPETTEPTTTAATPAPVPAAANKDDLPADFNPCTVSEDRKYIESLENTGVFPVGMKSCNTPDACPSCTCRARNQREKDGQLWFFSECKTLEAAACVGDNLFICEESTLEQEIIPLDEASLASSNSHSGTTIFDTETEPSGSSMNTPLLIGLIAGSLCLLGIMLFVVRGVSNRNRRKLAARRYQNPIPILGPELRYPQGGMEVTKGSSEWVDSELGGQQVYLPGINNSGMNQSKNGHDGLTYGQSSVVHSTAFLSPATGTYSQMKQQGVHQPRYSARPMVATNISRASTGSGSSSHASYGNPPGSVTSSTNSSVADTTGDFRGNYMQPPAPSLHNPVYQQEYNIYADSYQPVDNMKSSGRTNHQRQAPSEINVNLSFASHMDIDIDDSSEYGDRSTLNDESNLHDSSVGLPHDGHQATRVFSPVSDRSSLVSESYSDFEVTLNANQGGYGRDSGTSSYLSEDTDIYADRSLSVSSSVLFEEEEIDRRDPRRPSTEF